LLTDFHQIFCVLLSILDANLAGEESRTSDFLGREMQLQILHLSSQFLNIKAGKNAADYINKIKNNIDHFGARAMEMSVLQDQVLL
jgi:phosphoribosylaminoimidazole carboxylase (NCAIR synthetase)